MTRPLAVALTGGIAAGKSEALAAFARHGAATASADAIVHELLAGDEDVRAQLAARFGAGAADDRSRIAEVVFGDPAELEWLEALLHPRVVRVQREWLERVTEPLAVVEVPLLYETGGDARFDKVVVVTAPAQTPCLAAHPARRARVAVDPRRGEGAPRRLRVRERRHARGARGVRRRRGKEADIVLRRLTWFSCSSSSPRARSSICSGPSRRWYARLKYPLRYESIVRAHAQHYDLDPAFLAAVIEEESKFDSDAKSSAGAIGLMQLQPTTAKGIAIRTGGSKFVLSDLYNPELNVRYGAWYLHHLLLKYGDDERLALAAYNAGQENVDRGAPQARTCSSRRRARTSTRSRA